MEAIHQIDPGIHFDILTSVPEWFFKDSISGGFSYWFETTDIGFIQRTPFHEDLEQTTEMLDKFIPFDQSNLNRVSRLIRDLKCTLVICDISPLGIGAARRAGVRSILVENFTWDWIYENYPGAAEKVPSHIIYLKNLFDSVDFLIQTEPICRRKKAHLTLPPIARKIRSEAAEVRKRLGVDENQKMVLISLGGISNEMNFLPSLDRKEDLVFVIAGSTGKRISSGNVRILPRCSGVYHPDLVNASDAVIGKVGYSTLAEVFFAGVPFGYVARPDFPESDILINFIRNGMTGCPIPLNDFYFGKWIDCIEPILRLPRISTAGSNGADEFARFILRLI
jgi:UDP-N-acetylglucosamine:LPS N-acetylglucosamine transferase